MVAKPGKSLDTKQVGSELYDYMLRLKSFYGLHYAFGIVSSYEEWQIFWLSDSTTYAANSSSPFDPVVEISNVRLTSFSLRVFGTGAKFHGEPTTSIVT